MRLSTNKIGYSKGLEELPIVASILYNIAFSPISLIDILGIIILYY